MKAKEKKVWFLVGKDVRSGTIVRPNPVKYHPTNVTVSYPFGPSGVRLERDVEASELFPSEVALRKALVKRAQKGVDEARREQDQARRYHNAQIVKATRAHVLAQKAYLRVAK